MAVIQIFQEVIVNSLATHVKIKSIEDITKDQIKMFAWKNKMAHSQSQGLQGRADQRNSKAG